MNLVFKICLVNVALAVLLSLFYLESDSNAFIPIFGIMSLVLGIINLPIALVVFVFGHRVWAQGFLLSAGVLLLLGFALCTVVR